MEPHYAGRSRAEAVSMPLSLPPPLHYDHGLPTGDREYLLGKTLIPGLLTASNLYRLLEDPTSSARAVYGLSGGRRATVGP